MTTLAQRLGVTHPLVQAPMANSQGSALALAVAQAGALGSLACASLGHAALREELELLRSAGSINLNFFCHQAPAPDPARERAWRTQLAPYYRELGLDPETRVEVPVRAPFDAAVLQLISEYRPRVVSFHFGLPAPSLLARVKEWGALVMSSATTVEEGRWLEANGADVVIAQGSEAGGHRGMFLSADVTTQLGTLALVPQLVRALRVPVVAAGGIADEQGIRAALALGAQGVQLGTAYLCCSEAKTSAAHRAALARPESAHTALTNLFSGRPARGIVNRLMREQGPLDPRVPAFPLAGAALAPLRAAAERAGSGDFSPLWAGQHVRCFSGSASELTRELCRAF
jgi:nitronate monooxygenase